MRSVYAIPYLRTLVLILIALLAIANTALAASSFTWTDRTGPGSRAWERITSSSDGTKIAAGVGNLGGDYIYTSIDGGATWTAQTGAGSHYWQAITSSSDGTKLAAAVLNGDIYTSTDGGVTWTDQIAAGTRTWLSITSSADGTKLAAADWNNGHIYTSVDGGATWTTQINAGSRTWTAITSSSDGTKLAATVDSDYIYTSADGGVTWTAQTGSGSKRWESITSSSDGTRLAAGALSEFIYTSSDGGVTWTAQTAPGTSDWLAITSSAAGTRIAAGQHSGDIWTGSILNPAPVVAKTVSDSMPWCSGPMAPGWNVNLPDGGCGGSVPSTTFAEPATTVSVAAIATTTKISHSYHFTTDLWKGTTSPDVQTLQKYLNAHGFSIAQSGPGAPGQETEYFGAATQKALTALQIRYNLTPASGYFGPKTQALIAAL